MTSWITKNRTTYRLENTKTFFRRAGRLNRVWHRFAKGWSQALGEWVTICLGIAKRQGVTAWIELTGQSPEKFFMMMADKYSKIKMRF